MPSISDYPTENGDPFPEEADHTEDASSTLIVPPPDFKERLAAAQRARELQARRAMEFKAPEIDATNSTPKPFDNPNPS